MTELYLDYAGSALPIKDWVKESTDLIVSTRFSNPHSITQNLTESTHNWIKECRELLYKSIGASSQEYTLIFTSGATDSIHKIAEWFSFSLFAYTKRNHNSILGLRNVYKECIQLDDDLTTIIPPSESLLIAMPAECNFSGKKLNWINAKKKYPSSYLLLDVAKYTSTTILDLSTEEEKPDFIPISLYKWIGYPTGLGALFIHNRTLSMLNKTYYGGGTVDFNSLSEVKTIPKKEFTSRLEDGTLPFLSIISATIGLRHFLSEREERFLQIKQITLRVYNQMKELIYRNGQPLVNIYTPEDSIGSILTFNILSSTSNYIGYSDIERLASMKGIRLRVGCFCNPGACAIHLNLSDKELEYNYSQGHTCSNHKEIIKGKPTGAVRISFGWGSTRADGDRFIKWLTATFLDVHSGCAIPESYFHSNRTICISELIVYPIKSCPGFSVKKWRITNSGLEYDRMFAIYDTKNRLVTIQKNVKLGLILSTLDADTGELTLTNRETGGCICFNVNTYSESVKESCSHWLSEQLEEEVTCVKSEVDSNFSNTSPYLVISKESVLDLNKRILEKNQYIRMIPDIYWWKEKVVEWYPSIQIERFRPNIVLEGCIPYEEDRLQSFSTQGVLFKKEKDCERCYSTTMNIRKQTRDHELEPMKTLLTYRKMDNGVTFGTLFYTSVDKKVDIEVGEIDINN